MRPVPRVAAATILALAAYTLLTVAMTWPLARGLTRDLPADFGDPLLNAWVLAWDAQHMLTALSGHPGALAGYWNANIYHPHPLTLAYSEHLTAQALMILPVHAAAKNVILSYNVVFLSTFVLSALGMFLFVRALTGSARAAFLAGLAFGFAPYRFANFPHVQVLSSMWMPYALLGFHRFFETRRPRAIAGATSAWIAQNLSCGYYLLFFSPVVLLYAAWEIARRRLWRDTRIVAGAVASMAVSAIVAVPFLLPYWRLRQLGFNPRSLAETAHYAADVHGYFTIDINMWLWGRLVRAWPQPEGSLFPGFTIALLAGIAIWERGRAARSAASGTAAPKAGRWLAVPLIAVSVVALAMLLGWSLRMNVVGVELRVTSLERALILMLMLWLALLAVSARARRTTRHWLASPVAALFFITAFAFAMSLGPQIFAGGRLIEDRNIYWLFYHYVPGFDGLRVPARFAMIVALGLAALAGCGAAFVERRRHGAAIVALASILIVAESWAAPISVNVNSTDYKQSGLLPLPDRLDTPAEIPPVYRFAALLPASSALLELPFGEVAFETRYMFYSTTHWRPLVNGYSGGGPDDYGLWTERLKDLLTQPDAGWQAVRDSRATHLIVHEGSYANDRGRLISDWARAHGAQEIGAFASDRVFAVPR